MANIYDSSHSGQEIDAAVDAVQTTIPSQLTQIGLKIGDLTELETTDKTDLVSAINEVKNTMSTTAEDTTYTDNYGIGADNVQDAIDDALEQTMVVTTTVIDVSSLTVYNFALVSSQKWSSNYQTKHVVIPVQLGERYALSNQSSSNGGFYGFLTEHTYSSGGNVPYVTGTDRVWVRSTEPVTVSVPEGAAYLCLSTVDNNIAAVNWSVSLKTATDLKDIVAELESEVAELEGGKTIKTVSSMGTLNEPSYIIVASGKWSSGTSGHSAYFKEVEEGEVYRFLGNATNVGYYAFLKDTTRSSGGTPNYADGETGRHLIPINAESADITVPATTQYMYICNTNANQDQVPQALYRVTPVNDAVESLSSDVEEIKDVLGIGDGGETSGFSYYGERIAFSNTMNFSSYATNAIAGQSSAIYGDYLFIVKDKLTSITCYNMATKTLLYTLTTGYSKGSEWHCNQSQFGTLRVNENDVFPVLYITVTNDSNGRCSWVAYRIIPTYTDNEISSFTIEEVQTIYLPAMTDDNCLGNVNIAVDYERNLLWGYGRNNNPQAANYQKARFVCFPMPALTETTVTYEDSDIIDTFQDDWSMAYAQGGFIKNGKLVIMQGYASVNLINLRVIDLYAQRRQVTYADLLGNGFTQEPEGVFYYYGNIYTSANSTRIWRILIS